MGTKTLDKKDYQTLSEFRYRLRRFLRFSEQVTRKNGITPLQYLLLLHLRGFPGREWATVGELAERLQAQHHGVVALISRCEKLGWVERRQGQADRREVAIYLTADGERMAEKMVRLHRDELLSPGISALVPDLRNLHGE